MTIGVFWEHLRTIEAQTGEPIEEVVEKAKQLGIDFLNVNGDTWLESLALFDAIPLPVGGLHARFDLAHGNGADKAEQLIRAAAAHGVPNVMLVPGFIEPGDDREMVRNRIAALLGPLVTLAQSLGVRCSMEDYDHELSVYGTSGELLWFAENVPGLDICFDTGNFIYYREDERAALQKLMKHVCLVHAKDRLLTGREGEAPFAIPDGTQLYPSAVGSGVIPMADLFNALKQAGYDGGIVIEHFGSLQMDEDLRQSVDWIHKHW